MFQALWPITDESVRLPDLVDQAREDVPALLAQAHAKPTGQGRWRIADSRKIPGSGRTTELVLVYECPAVKTAPRVYHRPRLEVVA